MLRTKKKAEQLKQKIGKVTTLDAAASVFGNQPQVIDSLRMSVGAPRANFPYDPKAYGAIFNPSNKGKIVREVIIGEYGIYVVQVDNVTATPSESSNVAEMRKQQAGQTSNDPIGALKKAHKDRDIALHMILFGIDKDEYDTSTGIQFADIQKAGNYADNRTSPRIWPKRFEDSINAQSKLVDAIQEAMRPVVSVQSAGRSIERPVSLPSESGNLGGLGWLKPPVSDGRYRMSAFQSIPQELLLKPSDRVILDLNMVGNTPVLSLPSYADVIGRTDIPRGTDQSKNIHMTVLKNSLIQSGDYYDLLLTATLEQPLVATKAKEKLERVLPRFAWFRVAPGKTDDWKPLRVENIQRMVAPAWSLRAYQWERSIANAEPPRVEGFWLDAEPAAPTRLRFPREPKRELNVDGSDIKISDLSMGADRILQIRLSHSKGKPVIVRVRQDVEQLWVVKEHHKFFGKADQYWASFGPFDENASRIDLALEFYSIDQIMKASKTVPLLVRDRPTVAGTIDDLPPVRLAGDE